MYKALNMRRIALCGVVGAVAGIMLFAGACSSGDKNDSVSMSKAVELIPDADTTLTLSDYFCDDYSVIELKGATLSYVHSVIKLDSIIVVKADCHDGLLLAFDAAGNYIKPLIRRGQGPDEVMHLGAVKARGGHIYALVNGGRELWQIDPMSGTVTDKMKVPDELCYPDNFNFIGDNIVFYKDLMNQANSDIQYHLAVYDPADGHIVAQHYPIDTEASQYIILSSNGSLEYESDTTLLYMRSFMPGVDRIGLDSVKPYIRFTENKYTFPHEKLHGNYTFMDFVNYCRECDYIWMHNNINVGRNIIMSTFDYHGNRYTNFINIGDCSSQSALSVHDDIVTGGTYDLTEDEWGHVVGTHGDCFLIHYPVELFSDMTRPEALENEQFTTADCSTNEIIIILREKASNPA